MNRIVAHYGLSLDLAQIKCFRLNGNKINGKRTTLVIEYKTRYDYVHNPQTNQWEKQEYNDTIEMELADFEYASAIMGEWIEIWQDYLNNHIE